MKKTVLRILSVLVIILTLLTLTACALFGPNGTYKSVSTVGDAINETFTFSDKDKVVVSAFGLDITGTYKISGGEITITHSVLGIDLSDSYSFEMKGNSIFINGKEFVKQ